MSPSPNAEPGGPQQLHKPSEKLLGPSASPSPFRNKLLQLVVCHAGGKILPYGHKTPRLGITRCFHAFLLPSSPGFCPAEVLYLHNGMWDSLWVRSLG